MSRQIETLAYLGPEASFTHEAALRLQADHSLYMGVELVSAPKIATVCQMVVDGTVRYGIVPVENSTDGPVNDTLGALRQHPLRIRYEHTNPIRQSLYYPAGTSLDEIQLVISKDSALGQCRHTLPKIFGRNIPTEERPSTVAAILEVAQNNQIPMAAIGPRMAGRIQGLSEVLVQIDDVHDNPLNATRFIVVDINGEMSPTGNDKTSLISQMPDKPGSLYRVLDTFEDQGINLAKIKSFGRDGGDIAFLMDLQGHYQDLPLAAALKRLSQQGVGIKMLGSYPKDNYQPPEIPWELDMEDAIEKLKREVTNGVNHADKTIVAFTLADRVGALRDSLEPFNRRGINLTEIDSLPTGRLGEYVFYLAFENGISHRIQTINELKAHCGRLVLL